MHIVVAGGGMAGLSTALALGRSGHRVTVMERDDVNPAADFRDAFQHERRGIPHFHQPHAFLPRGRQELISLFPDVYSDLLNAGAADYAVNDKIRGQRQPEDGDLVYLSVRRPIIEWALRKALVSAGNVKVLARTRVAELIVEGNSVPAVRGVFTEARERIEADLVVDAQGRSSPLAAKVSVPGYGIRTQTSRTLIVYYSRYFQMRPGNEFPRGQWLTTPRGDLGYAGFSSFTGDNGTFALVFAVGSWDRDLRVLQYEAAWDAVARRIPLLAPLVDPAFAVPITPVLAMGELQNTMHHYVDDDSPRVHGMVPIGDALCHTDPTFALGLSFALTQARALAASIHAHGTESHDVLACFWDTVFPELIERYEFAAAMDDARARLWRGEALDPFHAAGCYPLFAMIAASVAALFDDDVLRKTLRRIGFLDRLSAFDNDRELHARIERIVEERLSTSPPPAPVSRDELLRVAQTALCH